MTIRLCQSSDLAELQRLTIEGFDGIAIDQSVEKALGPVGRRDWRWRKAHDIVEDIAANPAGIFVAEDDGRLLGYISTRIERESGRGRIPNLAVERGAQGRGLGRRLIEHALEYFRREGMTFAMIETVTSNPVGQHLYPSCGFTEVARQIHYAMKL